MGPSVFLWQDAGGKKKTARSIALSEIVEIRRGHKTQAFWSQAHARGQDNLPPEALCFSVMAHKRSVDVAANSKAEADNWIEGLKSVLSMEGQHVPVEEIEKQITKTKPVVVSSSSRDLLATTKPKPLERRSASHNTPSGHATLAEEGDDGNTTGTASGQTTWRKKLHTFARQNRVREVEKMFVEGCDVDLQEVGSGETVLLIACRHGWIKMVELALRWSARNDPHPDFGQTALQVAVSARQAGCAALLLETAAMSNADHVIVNHEDARKDAPLHIAARGGDLATAILLLNHGADFTLVDAHGRNAMLNACFCGHADMVAYLLEVGADEHVDKGDHNGNTALHAAALIGSEELVKLLLESAANVHFANNDGETPYQVAKSQGRRECMRLLEEHDSTVTNSSGMAYNRCLKPGESVAQEISIPESLPRPKPVGRDKSRSQSIIGQPGLSMSYDRSLAGSQTARPSNSAQSSVGGLNGKARGSQLLDGLDLQPVDASRAWQLQKNMAVQVCFYRVFFAPCLGFRVFLFFQFKASDVCLVSRFVTHSDSFWFLCLYCECKARQQWHSCLTRTSFCRIIPLAACQSK